ncbi:MAG: zinc-ribbon domain-containing protein [Ignavibacteriales bacterium]|nr:MAG: zinc-ribbon domain-containing protein [Ignavibacteriales bacterium]
MVRFCPACGTELKTEFKFCPACGFNLQEVHTKRETVEEKVIECENCGTDNPVGANICNGCGMKVRGEVKTTVATQKINKHQKTSKTKKEQQPINKVETREFDSKKVFGILAAVIAGSFIILFAAGVFDKPTASNINTGVTQNQGSGVDLSAVQKINELEASVKANPENYDLILELAHLRNDSGMYEKAIENYQEYLTKVPDDADARIDMGVCYYNLSRYNVAITEMIKALEYSPNHQIGHLNLGIVNLAAGNIDESKKWLQKAVSLGPETEVGKRAQELLTSH